MSGRRLLIRAYCNEDRDAVVHLWRRCDLVVPQNDPHDDIACKLAVQPELFLVGVVDDQLVATVMAGYEGHRGWLNYLAVSPDRQRRGWGRAMVQAAEEKLKAMGCPKINLQVRTSNREVIDFYEYLGYTIDDVVSLGKRIDG